MKVVRQVRLELSGGSTPDLLRPPLPSRPPKVFGPVSVQFEIFGEIAGAKTFLLAS